jgi:hypothetical protein
MYDYYIIYELEMELHSLREAKKYHEGERQIGNPEPYATAAFSSRKPIPFCRWASWEICRYRPLVCSGR